MHWIENIQNLDAMSRYILAACFIGVHVLAYSAMCCYCKVKGIKL